ncbi:type II secretion system F family protein [Pseudarthrobacter sp. H3Y2-7]|uniref:type II secretion system F family protein n=1 Tax=Pseudarthrobacter naphthalenicus TaxID=3031328 RepID=UPI0023AFBFD2|nr:type II secretion system F family protein [Pseudarthrobacter sp. H3Y2-7]MDE8667136.1 type II secretion system F family protein [Pseudarthrobacter sp. H3Y2-7]
MSATSPILLILGVLLCLASLVFLFVVTLRGREANIELARRRPGVAEQPSALTRVAASATSFVERNLSRNARFGSASSLEEAGLHLRQADFILLLGCAVVTMGVVGFVLGGLGLALVFALLTPFGGMLFLNIMAGKRRAKFESQLGDTLQMLSGGLRAGHSLLRAVDAVAQESDAPTSEEFARLVNETRLGRDLKDSMADSARRMRSEDFDWMAQAIEIHREVGGDLAEVLDHVGETIRERMQIKGQVQSLSAEGKLSAYILIALPIGIFLFLSFSNPGYLGVLYTNVLGWVMLGFGVVLLALGSFWLSRVVKIKF